MFDVPRTGCNLKLMCDHFAAREFRHQGHRAAGVAIERREEIACLVHRQLGFSKPDRIGTLRRAALDPAALRQFASKGDFIARLRTKRSGIVISQARQCKHRYKRAGGGGSCVARSHAARSGSGKSARAALPRIIFPRSAAWSRFRSWRRLLDAPRSNSAALPMR